MSSEKIIKELNLEKSPHNARISYYEKENRNRDYENARDEAYSKMLKFYNAEPIPGYKEIIIRTNNNNYYIALNLLTEKQIYIPPIKYAYSWAGSGYLMTPNLIPLEKFEELCQIKTQELANAQAKRSKQIKKPSDFIKQLFIEHEINYNVCSGGVHHSIKIQNLCPFRIEFINHKDGSMNLDVRLSFKNLDGHYINEHIIGNLTLSDPEIENKVLDYIKRWDNFVQIVMDAKLH